MFKLINFKWLHLKLLTMNLKIGIILSLGWFFFLGLNQDLIWTKPWPVVYLALTVLYYGFLTVFANILINLFTADTLYMFH